MTTDVLLETDNLILRTVSMVDIDGVASSWKLDEEPISHLEAEQKIKWMITNHALNVSGKIIHLCLAIIFKGDNKFAGWCGLDHTNNKDVDPALFYLLKSNYWGKGLATEAARALLNHAFTQLKLSSIHGCTVQENLASKRVLEKIGMKYIGLDEENNFVFAINRDEFLSTQQKV